MTVEELIEKLLELPFDAEVLTIHSFYNGYEDEMKDMDALLHLSKDGYVYIIPDDCYYEDFADR